MNTFFANTADGSFSDGDGNSNNTDDGAISDDGAGEESGDDATTTGDDDDTSATQGDSNTTYGATKSDDTINDPIEGLNSLSPSFVTCPTVTPVVSSPMAAPFNNPTITLSQLPSVKASDSPTETSSAMPIDVVEAGCFLIGLAS